MLVAPLKQERRLCRGRTWSGSSDGSGLGIVRKGMSVAAAYLWTAANQHPDTRLLSVLPNFDYRRNDSTASYPGSEVVLEYHFAAWVG